MESGSFGSEHEFGRFRTSNKLGEVSNLTLESIKPWTFRYKLSALLWEVPAGPHRAVGVWSSCPKGLLCGRVSKNHVCPSVCISVRRRPCVAIKNDQVLNGKSSLSKVNGSKRDPKKVHLQDLIARFWDVDEISGTQHNCAKRSLRRTAENEQDVILCSFFFFSGL